MEKMEDLLAPDPDDNAMHSHTHGGHGGYSDTSAVETPVSRKKFNRMNKALKLLLKKTKMCEECPNRYKAVTKGCDCCIEMED